MLNNFKRKIFPINDKIQTPPPQPAPASELTKHKTPKLKLRKKCKDVIITAEKYINDEIFWKYSNHPTPLYLLHDLLEAKQAKNEELVNNINDGLVDLRNAIIKKEISGNENSKKVSNIVEKILDFNHQQKRKKFKIFPPKQIVQKLPTTLSEVKIGGTSENLLN